MARGKLRSTRPQRYQVQPQMMRFRPQFTQPLQPIIEDVQTFGGGSGNFEDFVPSDGTTKKSHFIRNASIFVVSAVVIFTISAYVTGGFDKESEKQKKSLIYSSLGAVGVSTILVIAMNVFLFK